MCIASERGEVGVAFGIATILMILTFILNLAANLAGKKTETKGCLIYGWNY